MRNQASQSTSMFTQRNQATAKETQMHAKPAQRIMSSFQFFLTSKKAKRTCILGSSSKEYILKCRSTKLVCDTAFWYGYVKHTVLFNNNINYKKPNFEHMRGFHG